MALRRSWVRIPLGPLNLTAPVLVTGVCVISQSRSSRLSVSELGSPGASPNTGIHRMPLRYSVFETKTELACYPESYREAALVKSVQRIVVSAGIARYCETER